MDHKELNVWKKSIDLATNINEISFCFLSSEVLENHVESAIHLNLNSAPDSFFKQIPEVPKLMIGFRNYNKKKSNHDSRY